MKRNSEPFVRQMRDGQRGQSLVVVACCLVVLLATCAIVIDIGGLYYSYEQLLAATDAAALAGGASIPQGDAITVAEQYSAVSGDLNNHANLQSVTVTATLECYNITGMPNCLVYGSQPSANAIVVTETATVPTFFAKIFGVKSMKISATATASAKGGGGAPYNVMMVLDTTQSMNTTDTNCTVPGISNPTREQCAIYGVRILLSGLDPCPSTTPSCVAGDGDTKGNGNVTGAVDEVGLMVFPGLTPTETSTLSNPPVAAPTASDDYTCPTSNPAITSYNNNPGYMILPLGSNYRLSNSSSTLNSSADVVIATGGGSCNGLSAPGGEGTFYAGVIAAAQSYLTNSANSRPNTKNVMILLSDGDANASSSQMAGKATSYSATAECQQAVTAATNAKNAGILIYSVAYGAETTGCTAGDTLSPCQTMEDIASTPTTTYFFSDYNQSGTGHDMTCKGRDTTNLDQIFTDIASDLTTSRLIQNQSP
jgi:Putative Tad-like Flp pilus-assembly/von Willebrand factor type A domain